MHELVMGGRMMFGVVITHIVGARLPIDKELSLEYPIADPVESHVRCAGSALFDGVVGNARGCRVVSFYWCHRLWMS